MKLTSWRPCWRSKGQRSVEIVADPSVPKPPTQPASVETGLGLAKAVKLQFPLTALRVQRCIMSVNMFPNVTLKTPAAPQHFTAATRVTSAF